MKKLMNTTKDTLNSIFSSSKGFTLLELLVVVLIIGILASIALPQYKKAVMKAKFYRGIPIVESLYQAQQRYYLTNGTFATDTDDLDISVPSDWVKRPYVPGSTDSKYDCPWGVIGIGSASNIHHIMENKILYSHYYQDYVWGGLTFETGKRYCFAKGTSKVALSICESMGGELIYYHETGWNRYKLP